MALLLTAKQDLELRESLQAILAAHGQADEAIAAAVTAFEQVISPITHNTCMFTFFFARAVGERAAACCRRKCAASHVPDPR